MRAKAATASGDVHRGSIAVSTWVDAIHPAATQEAVRYLS